MQNAKDNVSYDELKQALIDVASFIKKGRDELASNPPHEILEEYIPNANDELNAIINGTEKASNDIMDACDAIDQMLSGLDDEVKANIQEQTAKIFSCCGFQDITSQRATKIIRYLGEVEAKTVLLVGCFKNFFDKDGTFDEELSKMEGLDERSEDQRLMNGPALEGEGLEQDAVDQLLNDVSTEMSQEEIDKLLNDF